MATVSGSEGARRRRLRACERCDRLVALPALRPGERADCPRCGHALVRRHRLPEQRTLAWGLAAAVALAVALMFPFIGFEVSGLGNRITLIDTVVALIGYRSPLVALVVLLTVVVLPAVYLLGLIVLQVRLLGPTRHRHDALLARAIAHVRPWLMADVFILSVLVSVTKVAGLATVSAGPALWAYAAFALLLLKTQQSVDDDWLWFSLAGEPRAPAGVKAGGEAAAQGVAGCAVCGLVNGLGRDGSGRCRRCGERLHGRRPRSLQVTVALLVVSVLLYIPANVYPIMSTTRFGYTEASTILEGVLSFVRYGDFLVAAIIFIASVLVPLAKFLALGWLCLVAVTGRAVEPLTQGRLHEVVDFIGRWSMVDVFVVAVLTGLIRTGNLMAVTPGPAALAFAGMVVTGMLAAMSFDTRLLWDAAMRRDRPEEGVVHGG